MWIPVECHSSSIFEIMPFGYSRSVSWILLELLKQRRITWYFVQKYTPAATFSGDYIQGIHN
jgi:hypothetical protein